MKIDRPTLEHLDVLSHPSSRGRSVFELLDHTSSIKGRETLRRRVLSPPASAEEVAVLQEIHQALADEVSIYRPAVARARIDEVEDYLRLSWLRPSEMPIGARLRGWHATYRRDLRSGYDACRASLPAAITLATAARGSRCNGLQHLGARLDGFLHDEAMIALRGHLTSDVPSSGQLLSFDEIGRGRAGAALAQMVDCVAELDALASIGEATRLNGWQYPTFVDRLHVRGLVHPLLGDSAIPNDLVDVDQARIFFVTGPNMAGKSTFLKALALAVFLAHIGAGVPAQAMETPFFTACFSCANVADDISAGESSFLAEIRRVGAMARTIVGNERTFAIMDEPFRGTNIHDATDATLAVLRRLIVRPDATVLVASHLADVAAALDADPRVALLHFSASCERDVAVFDFRLSKGASAQRLGMLLLRREGVLDVLEQGMSADVP